VLLTEIGEVSTRKRHRIVRTQKRQGPQINLLRPDDTIEACSIWVIAHVCLLNKAGAVPSAGAKLEMPPSETRWKHWSEGSFLARRPVP
jgi:hypothetical protein